MNTEPLQGWHLEKKVSVGHIITTLSALIGAMVWANTVETRLTRLESPSPLDARLAVVESQQVNTANKLSDIKETLRRIEDKLDRKVDKE